jgi:cellulose synthase/poly-beta-1,6-N-acetylglucosamine synthase-like glycosyltransferase
MASAIIISFILLFLFVHTILIENYRKWFLKVRPFEPNPAVVPAISFSVIISARNEENQIAKCLQSVLDQHYPFNLFEVIVADDYSTDDTARIVQQMQNEYKNLRLLQIEKLLPDKQLNSYKKKALELAIQEAEGDWIVTTDADCMVSKEWLSNFSNFIQQHDSVFVAAPVRFINTGSFVSIFQCLDFISLQGITAASVSAGFHTMCNGANLAYNKKVFYKVDGFKGIDNIASGDDMLLMHKIYTRHKTRVHYLFSQQSIVATLPMETWKDFFNQRIRWASKADKFEDKRIMFVLIFVYFFNLSFLLLPLAAIWINNVVWYWLAMLAAKTIIDFRFMIPVAKFFNEEKMLWWFPVMQPFHIAYTIIAGWLGKFGKYSWKGRVVK